MSCCPASKQPVSPDELLVSLDTHKAARNGVVVHLTPNETVLLFLLDAKAGATASKPYLLNGLYGAQDGPGDGDNLLRVMIRRLRIKLAALEVRIETILREGYRLLDPGHLNA